MQSHEHWLDYEADKHREAQISSFETQFSNSIHTVRDEMAQDTHPDSVYEWRRKEFIRFGYKVAVAERLARTKIELRRIEALLKEGCGHATAARILEGTNAMGRDEEPVRLVIEDDGE